jgi:hypothetical protein
MQICGIWVNALGLLLNLLGASILLFSPARGAAVHSREPLRSFYLGFALLVVGFLLQFIFAVCPLLVG